MAEGSPTIATPSLPGGEQGSTPRVVVVGGGFAGLEAVKVLRKLPVRVTVLDRANHHLFQPLLYQVATAALNPADIASPIRRIFRRAGNVEVLLAAARSIDVAGRCVETDGGCLPFDYLILATGATHSYFGHPEWETFAPGLKSIEDALEIRRRVLTAFEVAERTTNPAQRRACLTFVIVGGGPTGTELAGTLAEVARKALARDFRRIDPAEARILLIEGSPRVLSAFPEDLSASAREQLQHIGVEVHTDSRVTQIDAEGVQVGGERIAARTVLWAAGVEASPIGKSLGVPLDRAGRVVVEPDLTIPGSDRIYVVGDLMAFEQDGQPVPGIAPVAMQAGRHAARNIQRAIESEFPKPFRYNDKGSLATIGRGSAVANIRGWHFSGLPAWMLWLFVHIMYLVGFRNRLGVLLQWGYSFFTFDRGARLITGPWRPPAPAESARAVESREEFPPALSQPAPPLAPEGASR